MLPQKRHQSPIRCAFSRWPTDDYVSCYPQISSNDLDVSKTRQDEEVELSDDEEEVPLGADDEDGDVVEQEDNNSPGTVSRW